MRGRKALDEIVPTHGTLMGHKKPVGRGEVGP